MINPTPKEIGKVVAAARIRLGITLLRLALTTGTGVRFLVDLEKGKASCHLGKALTVLYALGIKVQFTPPVEPEWKPRDGYFASGRRPRGPSSRQGPKK